MEFTQLINTNDIWQKVPTFDVLIQAYNLKPHIEGGYFREDFRSELMLPKKTTGTEKKSIVSSCYYLLTHKDRSLFHRINSDEIWHFLLGGPVSLYEITDEGNFRKIILGTNIYEGHSLKHHVKAKTWVGAIPEPDISYTFLSRIVFPGFESTDWEKGDAAHLKKICWEGQRIVDLLT